MTTYTTINGIKYNKDLIDLADSLHNSHRDGRISKADAQKIYQQATAAAPVDHITTSTLAYILEHYTWTSAAKEWFTENTQHLAITQATQEQAVYASGSVQHLAHLLGIGPDGNMTQPTFVLHATTLAVLDTDHSIPDLLETAFQKTYVTLSAATAQVNTEKNEVVVSGTSGFIYSESTLPCAATFQMANGNVSVVFAFQLPATWKFSDSFSYLPTSIRLDDPDKSASPLDYLEWEQPYFYLSSHGYQDPTLNQTLAKGINFRSKVKPNYALSVFEQALTGEELVVTATINVTDKVTDAPTLSASQYPWDSQNPPPGINLRVELNKDVELGPMKCSLEAYRVYSPLSLDGWTSESRYIPTTVYTGKLDVASAGKLGVDITIAAPVGLGVVQLDADFKNASLTNLEALGDMVGKGISGSTANVSPTKAMDSLKTDISGTVLSELSLISASIEISFVTQIAVNSVSVTVGMPHLNWTVLETPEFKVNSIYTTFGVHNPFNSAERSLELSLTGYMDVCGIDLLITAFKSKDQFQVSASLAKGFDLNLHKVMSTCAPAFPAVSDLEVNRLTIMLAFKQEYSLYLSMADAPNPWIIPMGVTQLQLSNITLLLTKTAGAGVGVSFSTDIKLAGVDFYLQIDKNSGSGLSLQAIAAQNTPVDLTSLVSQMLSSFGVNMESVKGKLPKVNAENIAFSYDSSTTNFNLSGDVDAQLPFTIGDKTTKLDTKFQISARKNSAGKHIMAGLFTAQLDIGSCTFDISLSMGDADEYIMASFQSTEGVDLESLALDLADKFFGLSVGDHIPKVGAKLTAIAFAYDITSKQFTFSANSNYGDVFIVIEDNAGWGFALGVEIDFETLSGTSGLNSGLKDIVQHMDSLGLEKVFAIGSTINQPNFQIPALPQLGNFGLPPGNHGAQQSLTLLQAGNLTSPQYAGLHQVTVSKQPPSATFGMASSASSLSPSLYSATLKLEEGFTVGAVMGGGGSASGIAKLFSLLKESQVVIQAFIADDAFEIYGRVNDVKIPLTSGSVLKLQEVSIDVKLGEPLGLLFGLQGSIKMTIDKTQLTVVGRLAISPEELVMSITIDENKGPGLPGPLPGIHFDEIGFELGIYDEPPGVGIGLMGKFHIGKVIPQTDDSFAFVLEVIEEVPDPLYLSFLIEELDLATGETAFTNEPASQHIQDISKHITGTDISFHYCESLVILPDGSTATPGFGFKGIVTIFGFTAYANFQAGISGITADAMMDPLHIKNVVSITGDGKGLKLQCIEDENGNFIPVNHNRQLDRVQGTDISIKPVEHQFIKPGGAVFHLGTNSSPYLHVSINISLFDAIGECITATIDDTGMSFKFSFHASDILHLNFVCKLHEKMGFYTSADFQLHYKGHIGPIIPHLDFTAFELDVNIGANMQLTVDENEFDLIIEAHFEFEGHTLNIPKLEIKVDFSSFKDLPEKIFKQLEDNAKEIFKDLFSDIEKLGKDIEKGVEDIGKGAVVAAKAVAQGAETACRDIKADAEKAVHVLGTATADLTKEAGDVKAAAEKITSDAVAEASKIGDKAIAEVDKIGGDITDLKNMAEAELSSIASTVASEVSKIGTDISNLEHAAAAEVEQLGQDAIHEAVVLIGDAKQEAERVLNDAKAVVADIDAEAVKAWDDAKHWADELKDKLAQLAKEAEEKLKSAYHSVSHFVGHAAHSVAHFFHL